MDERVIERSVEGNQLIRSSALYLNASQTGIPGSVGIVSDGCEIEVGILSRQVRLSIGDTNIGDAHLNMDDLVRGRIESHECTGLRTSARSRTVVDGSSIPGAVAGKGAIKPSGKVKGIVIAATADRARIKAGYLIATGRDSRASIRISVDAAPRVDNHGRGS